MLAVPVCIYVLSLSTCSNTSECHSIVLGDMSVCHNTGFTSLTPKSRMSEFVL